LGLQKIPKVVSGFIIQQKVFLSTTDGNIFLEVYIFRENAQKSGISLRAVIFCEFFTYNIARRIKK